MENAIVESVACLDDNYSYLIHCPQSKKTALVDCGDAEPVLERLERKGWQLNMILVTHYHHDHTGDIPEMLEYFPQAVTVLPKGEKRLNVKKAREVGDGDSVQLGQYAVQVFHVPGHTMFCVNYYVDGNLFTGDTLFSAGCGRLFEGGPADLEKAMDKLASFPDETKVYCGHEYTLANLQFAATVEPENRDAQACLLSCREKLSKGEFTVPSLISLEKKINPFFRIDKESVARFLDPEGKMTRTERMGALRTRKDNF